MCRPSIADRWELLDKELVDREELGRDPDGARRYRLSFARPVVDKATVRFRYRLPLVPGLDAKSVREITIPEISFKDVSARADEGGDVARAGDRSERDGQGWVRSSDDVRVEPAGEGALISFEDGDPSSRKRPFTFKALALEPVPLPSFVVPRLLLKTVSGGDDSIRNSALYWVESHGPDFPFALPEGARWIGARVDGRLAEQVDYDPSRVSYRLRFPGEVGSRPALVELEYQLSEQVTRSKWPAPRLLDGGVVLQALWEVRLPLSKALLGVPSGWSDENQWYWSGYMWKRRPWKNLSEINEWVLGAGAASHSLDDIDGSNLDDSDRYLFSRSGPPVALGCLDRSPVVAGGDLLGRHAVRGFFRHFLQAAISDDLVGDRGAWPSGRGPGAAERDVPGPRVRSHRRRVDAFGAGDRGPDRAIAIVVGAGPRRGPARGPSRHGFVPEASRRMSAPTIRRRSAFAYRRRSISSPRPWPRLRSWMSRAGRAGEALERENPPFRPVERRPGARITHDPLPRESPGMTRLIGQSGAPRAKAVPGARSLLMAIALLAGAGGPRDHSGARSGQGGLEMVSGRDRAARHAGQRVRVAGRRRERGIGPPPSRRTSAADSGPSSRPL